MWEQETPPCKLFKRVRYIIDMNLNERTQDKKKSFKKKPRVKKNNNKKWKQTSLKKLLFLPENKKKN
jgi:hypothetical protein